ncbi:hypothetical protein Dcar01_03114 [Deinococcus carri]|uniref:Uncharacterized protein n=1 Tax=Deinococcus carri TaxID=1211323 RepID=A0ABP9WAJ0_9DEIO
MNSWAERLFLVALAALVLTLVYWGYNALAQAIHWPRMPLGAVVGAWLFWTLRQFFRPASGRAGRESRAPRLDG